MPRRRKEAFSDGTKAAAFAAAGFLVVGFLATLSLGSGRRIEDADEEHEAPAATET